MIRLIQRRLIIPRGDTGTFSIPTLGAISDGDLALFGIFDSLTHQTVALKAVAATSPVITIPIAAEDTINLEPKKYNWDISIYKSPIYDEEGELVGAEEINSYYSAFKLPVCEITEVAFDMNRERWRTRDLLLNTENYQPDTTTGNISSIQAVYPWENMQKSQLIQQLYDIAADNGYTGTQEEFLQKYAESYSNGTIAAGAIDEFPIPGNPQDLYFDNNTGILYYYIATTDEVDEALLQLVGVRVVEDTENETTHLYVPIKALGIIN